MPAEMPAPGIGSSDASLRAQTSSPNTVQNKPVGVARERPPSDNPEKLMNWVIREPPLLTGSGRRD